MVGLVILLVAVVVVLGVCKPEALSPEQGKASREMEEFKRDNKVRVLEAELAKLTVKGVTDLSMGLVQDTRAMLPKPGKTPHHGGSHTLPPPTTTELVLGDPPLIMDKKE